MDAVQKQQTNSLGSNVTCPRPAHFLFEKLPAELRNKVYDEYYASDEKQEKEFYYLDQKGNITTATERYVYKNVVAGTQHQIFDPIRASKTMASEILARTIQQVVFDIRTPEALKQFSESLRTYIELSGLKTDKSHQIAIDLTSNMTTSHRSHLDNWNEIEDEHGNDFEEEETYHHGRDRQGTLTRLKVSTHDHIKQWLVELSTLPNNTEICLTFPFFWRDFRSLRGLSARYGLSNRTVKFCFPPPSSRHPEYDYCRAQTMAAIKGFHDTKQTVLTKEEREHLVAIGCRGFDGFGRRPNA
ncbi:hypothetical protein GLAREA_11204 [Glarea lozoyensis ATCC 20868]|uniref:Uncharacterized protein n=1 Tax=Glarea lozoyensis (strain ATCC 20868 / MF5171) TaxID=1116229 RepID=S3DCP6_GLAL2|nr:uncharacterized protein GLAREA_11204 [Glarea lozoyensis ATCC 20868]EPE35505.1 hypothetical protein GLAREA_11204 [Glarea lozoyensis ATCC 20868]